MIRAERRAIGRRLRAVGIALVVPALLAHAALAQTHASGTRPAHATAAHAPAPAPKKAPADGGTVAPGTLATASPAPAPAVATTASSDAGVVETKAPDGGAKVFKFSELDIEGRLKSPQLVYFLRRVRAEFAAGELGHRSFMREMSETRKERTF
jgi:hypothetical protein